MEFDVRYNSFKSFITKDSPLQLVLDLGD
uniref:Uncharacterized protein MANES_04G065100 n=1 Tax=Rhizophora mucronata TaxID=61149 RepID=A0A2P2M789_RHIMU